MGIQANRCGHPCSTCMCTRHNMGSALAVARDRDVLGPLSLQLEAAQLQDNNEGGARPAAFAPTTSALPFLTGLGAVHFLGAGNLML